MTLDEWSDEEVDSMIDQDKEQKNKKKQSVRLMKNFKSRRQEGDRGRKVSLSPGQRVQFIPDD